MDVSIAKRCRDSKFARRLLVPGHNFSQLDTVVVEAQR